MAFFLQWSYAIVRPSTESLFLKTHSSKALPMVWLLLAITVVLVVVIYNRYVTKKALLPLLGNTAGISAILLGLLLLARWAKAPGVHYALYIWKDIYIVILTEIFFSYTNHIFPIKTARWVYGLFGGCGAVGAITGSLLVGVLAKEIGSVATLWTAVPILLLVWFGSIPFAKLAGGGSAVKQEKAISSYGISNGVKVVRRSSYLLLMLGLVALVQIAITLIDYQFNTIVESVYPDTDQRTGIIGKVYASISLVTVVLHSLTGPILRLLSVPITLLGVPFLLGSCLVSFTIAPGLLTVSVLKNASKSFDYSIFRAAKEILYIPLTYREKTAGKSIVDMLTYRTAKVGASLILMIFVALGGSFTVSLITGMILVGWLLLTIKINRGFRAKVSRQDEMGADY